MITFDTVVITYWALNSSSFQMPTDRVTWFFKAVLHRVGTIPKICLSAKAEVFKRWSVANLLMNVL